MALLVVSANVFRLSSQNGHGAQDLIHTLLFFLRLESSMLAIICTTRSAAGRQPRPVSSKGSHGDASQPVSVTTVDGRTVRRWSGGTVASQEPCRPVPVRCSSHRSAGVAPPVRWRPCPIGPPLSFGIRWYLLNNVAR